MGGGGGGEKIKKDGKLNSVLVSRLKLEWNDLNNQQE